MKVKSGRKNQRLESEVEILEYIVQKVILLLQCSVKIV